MSSSSNSSTEEADLKAIQPTTLSKLGGALVMLAGLFGALLAVQTMMMVLIEGKVALFIPPLLVVSLVSIPLGFRQLKLKSHSAVSGAIGAGAVAVISGVWLVLSLSGGLVSLVGLGVPPLAAAGALVSLLNLDANKRADDARSRLRDQGIDLG